MKNLEEQKKIQKAIVIDNIQIAKHTYHLKIQSDDFRLMDYIPGFTLDIYLGYPLLEDDVPYRKYSFWNYEPVYHIADIAICTFSMGIGSRWVRTLKKGDFIYFKPPRGKLLIDESANQYLLIGDVTALSHLYEINRNLPISKTVISFIHSKQIEDIFPDIDLSYPLDFKIINSTSANLIVKEIFKVLSINLENTIAYVLGEPNVCISIHNYLKRERNFPIQNIKAKPFWKPDKTSIQ